MDRKPYPFIKFFSYRRGRSDERCPAACATGSPQHSQRKIFLSWHNRGDLYRLASRFSTLARVHHPDFLRQLKLFCLQRKTELHCRFTLPGWSLRWRHGSGTACRKRVLVFQLVFYRRNVKKRLFRIGSICNNHFLLAIRRHHEPHRWFHRRRDPKRSLCRPA
jgi:hypothetical protein